MARRYNRYHSRFDQPDPYDGSYNTSDPQSFNRYAYTQGDPVNFTDPTGMFLPGNPLPSGPINPGQCYTLMVDGVEVGTTGNCGGGVPVGDPGGGGGTEKTVPDTAAGKGSPKCHQGKRGEDRQDIINKLNQATGGAGGLSGITGAGQNSPEGIVGNVSNRAAFIAALDANSHFRHRTLLGGIDHYGQVGGSLGDVLKGNGNVLEYRSYTDKDGLGPDTTGRIRSLQVVVGREDPNGGATIYSDLDCVNPDQDLVSFAEHNGPIIGRGIGSFFGRIFHF